MRKVKRDPRAVDETGNVYGRLTVLGPYLSHDKDGQQWLCRCECGNHTVCRGSSLRMGNTTSCGCGRRKHLPDYANARDFGVEEYHPGVGPHSKARFK